MWHASKALEMEHLNRMCTKVKKQLFMREIRFLVYCINVTRHQTLHDTLCEDTVFWDLNYGMQFEALGTGEIMDRALKVGN